MEAVILWQSLQLQTKLSTRPGLSVGYGFDMMSEQRPYEKLRGGKIDLEIKRRFEGQVRRKTYECYLHGATEACGSRFTFFRPAIIRLASQREVGFRVVHRRSHDLILWMAVERGYF